MSREDLRYFNEKAGYRRIFEGMRQKYKSLGRLGGVVKLEHLSDEEREVLANHFKRDYTAKKSVSINIAKFEETLKGTRFENYTLLEILEHYFGERLTSKQEDMEMLAKEREGFFNELFNKYDGHRCIDWLGRLYDGTAAGVRAVNQRYLRDREQLKRDIAYVCLAIDNLPVYKGEKMRLPVFSSHITRNPHYFDLNTDSGNMLLNALRTLLGWEKAVGSEEISELYYRAGILIDEISNYVTILGLLAYEGNEENCLFRAAYDSNQVLQISLLNLSKIDRAISPSGKVYVIENPSVFASIVDAFGELFPPIPLVCAFGQPRLACLVLLDMLCKEGAQIYYSGDFDPEGLTIADRLYKRYKGSFHFLRYGVQDYMKALSYETIDAARLRKLDKIEAHHLFDVAEEMKKTKKAGYQESVLDEIIEDIRSIQNHGSSSKRKGIDDVVDLA